MIKLVPGESGSALKQTSRVVVVYENAATREQALSFCEHLARESIVGAPLDPRWFSFASLANEPQYASEAAEVAATADVIVFSFTSAGDFPEELKAWIERALGKRTKREGALAGLVIDRPRDAIEGACVKEIYLRHAAHRAWMDYLSQENPTTGRAIPDSIDSFNERAGQVTSVLDQILQTHPPTPPPV